MFALGGILKLAADLFALIGPLAIQKIVQYIEQLYADVARPEHWNQKEQEVEEALLLSTSSVSTEFDEVFGTNMGQVRVYCSTWSDLLANGWCIAWIVLLAALTQGALSQASTHILNMTGLRIKSSLQGLIYRKSLLLNWGGGGVESDEKPKNDDAKATSEHVESLGGKFLLFLGEK